LQSLQVTAARFDWLVGVGFMRILDFICYQELGLNRPVHFMNVEQKTRFE
jgi:hypothetical protein